MASRRARVSAWADFALEQLQRKEDAFLLKPLFTQSDEMKNYFSVYPWTGRAGWID
jgi:hypothetical protein